jgi:hypothetical protein
VPDIPHAVEDATSVEHKWIKVHFGLAPIYDYTWLTQDEASVEQVGVQEDQGQWRSARIQARGTLFNHHDRPWRFLLSFEYRGFDSNPDETWTWTDVSLTVPVGPLGDLSMGKIKEPFVYEMVGDAANLPHLERLLSPFFTSRSIGLRLDKSLFDQRATAAIGAFNDWFVKDLDYDDSGWDIAGRVTTVPVWGREGKRYLHVGSGWRYVGADDGLLRYRGRPESNVTDYYLDATFGGAKGIPASHANHWSAEALWNEGPVSVLAEYTGERGARPALRRLVRRRVVGGDGGAPAVRPQGGLRTPGAADAPLGRPRAGRPIRRGGHRGQRGRRWVPGEVVHRRELVGHAPLAVQPRVRAGHARP